MGAINNPQPPDLVGRSIYANANDGSETIAINTTLARDMYYENLTINNGVTLFTANCRLFVRGTLLNNGVIHNNGPDGAAGAVAAGGAGGVAPASWSLKRATSGSNGGNPASNGANVAAASYRFTSRGGYGSNGNATAPGDPDTSTPVPDEINGPFYYPYAVELKTIFAGAIYEIMGSGGGSGGGGSTLNGGGGGGAGGGSVVICARRLINNGIISCRGGAGGNGYNLSATPCGGGGGGAGGLLILLYNYFVNTGSLLYTGGAGGLGTGGATNGDTGDIGILIQLPNVT